MAKKKTKPKKKAAEQVQRPKDFLDMIAPAAIKFNTDHFILGSRYHTAMTLKSYPPMTDELALLRGLGDMGGVNLRLTARQVTPAEEDAILHAATNKSRMERSNTNDYKQSVTAEANLRDMAELLERDMAHLDAIQFSSASSRKFVLVLPLDEKAGADESTLRQLEKSICDHGLRVRLAEEQDVKRLLAIYYRQDLTTEVFRDYDGEEYMAHG